MKLTLINHSSVLFDLNKGKQIFLTDFWNQSVAFGSWLPSAPPFYNPIYLAGLSYQDNFYFVISHPHDDHIDDYFLKKYFNKDMKIILNKFSSKALVRRLEKNGFKNLNFVGEDGKDFGEFQCTSIFDTNFSDDDCSLIFRDKNFCFYHGNDNWFELSSENLNKAKVFKSDRKMLYAAQTNSASGHPLTYQQFSKEEQQKILKEKSLKMLVSGFKNISNLDADYFLSYAGFSKPYVKNEEYDKEIFTPTYENLVELLKDVRVEGKEKLLNIFCGGTVNLNDGNISYPFLYNSSDVFKITDHYYREEKIISKCHTYNADFKEETNEIKDLETFLTEFDLFVKNYLQRSSNFFSTILGKKIRFEVTNSKENLICNLEIGKGISNKKDLDVNKIFRIDSKLFKALTDKKIVFDDLYTGYMTKIERHPKDTYNRDIIIYLVMFGYKYKNTK